MVTAKTDPQPLDAALAAGGTLFLALAWLLSGMSLAVALAVPAFIAMLLFRGALMPILVPLYFPATIELGLPFGTVTLLYFFAYGALLLHLIRYGLGSGWQTLALLLPMVAGAMLLAFGHAGVSDEFIITGRPLVAMVALAVVLARVAGEDPQAFRRSLVVAGWVGALVAVLAIYQTIADTWPFLDDFASAPQYRSDVYFGRPGGTQGHPILLAAVMTAMVVVALVLRPRFWQIIVGLCGLAIILSGSRSAYLALAVAVLVMFLGRGEKRTLSIKQLVGSSAAGLVGLLIVSRLNEGVSAQLGEALARLTLAGDASAEARSDRISAAWHLINASTENFWLGQGPRADAQYAMLHGFGDGGQALTFDNTYLIWWFNYGLLGVVLLVVTLLALWRAGGRLGRPLLAVVAAEMLFFDFTGWVAAMGILALTAGAAVYDRRSEVAPQGHAAEDVPAGPRNRPGRRDTDGKTRQLGEQLAT